MHVRGSGSGRVFPNYTTVAGRRRLCEVTVVVGRRAAVAGTAVTGGTGTAKTATVMVLRRRTAVMIVTATATTAVVILMVMMVTPATAGPLQLVGPAAQLPALERRRPVARGLAVVHRPVVAVAARTAAAVDRMPAAQQHAPREEQLEEQPLELLAEYHVDDEVDGRVDRDQQVADLDQLIDRYAVERLGHV